MLNPQDPKSPYSPNDPRNPRNPTDQKNPGNPNDPKNPKNPVASGNPQVSVSTFNQPEDNSKPNLSTESPQLGSSTLHPSRQDNKTIQASDIVAILQNKGTATLNGRTLTLKEPSVSDQRLQEMIQEPTLAVSPIGKPSENGAGEYELVSTGRKITIKIDVKNDNTKKE